MARTKLTFGPPEVIVDRRSDGAMVARSPHPLGSYPRAATDWLDHWAKVAPERVFLAEREGANDEGGSLAAGVTAGGDDEGDEKRDDGGLGDFVFEGAHRGGGEHFAHEEDGEPAAAFFDHLGEAHLQIGHDLQDGGRRCDDDDLEQRRPHDDIGRHAQQVDHRRHDHEAAADAHDGRQDPDKDPDCDRWKDADVEP